VPSSPGTNRYLGAALARGETNHANSQSCRRDGAHRSAHGHCRAPAGAQTLRCGGRIATIVGTNGNDVIEGTSGPDVIVGLGGDDIINGGGGADIICGNSGNDRIDGQAGRDRLIGGAGNDVLVGGGGRDLLIGGGGSDALYGGGGNDILKGGPGDDYLDGGPGSDDIDAGSGTDFCVEGLAPGCAPSRIGTEITSITSQSCGYSSWSTQPTQVNGRIIDEAVSCRSDDVGDQGFIEYDLGRRYRVFTAWIGIGDDALDRLDRYRYRVYGDGQLLSSIDIGFGEVTPVRVAVGGVLRLRLEVTKIDGPDNNWSRPAWAVPRVLSTLVEPSAALASVTPLPSPRLGSELTAVTSRSCGYSGWAVGVYALSGTIYSDSLSCRSDDVGDEGWIRYNLSRAYSTLDTVLGIEDTSRSATDTYRFTFLVDGVVAARHDVAFGSALPVTLDVRGGLRLELRVAKIAGPDNSWSRPVFAEPTLRS
jgi:Ca2+-binding RTX toxin-like protein